MRQRKKDDVRGRLWHELKADEARPVRRDRRRPLGGRARLESFGGAATYFGIASNDDQRQPDAKDKLREAFAAAKVPAEIDVYAAKHGWCVPDMPSEKGVPIYDKPEAERAWQKLTAFYRRALA